MTQTPSDGEASVPDIWGVKSTPLLLLPGPLWPGVVVPDRVPPMAQIVLLKNIRIIGPYAKNNNKTQHKICKYERTMNVIP